MDGRERGAPVMKNWIKVCAFALCGVATGQHANGLELVMVRVVVVGVVVVVAVLAVFVAVFG